MLSFSFGELLVVLVVAFLALEQKDVYKIISQTKRIITEISTYYQRYVNYFKESLQRYEEDQENTSEVVNYIIDLEGNMQRTYDLSKIMPEIKKPKNDDIHE